MTPDALRTETTAAELVFSELYWSEAYAARVVARLRRKGYLARARWSMTCDCQGGWIVEAWA